MLAALASFLVVSAWIIYTGGTIYYVCRLSYRRRVRLKPLPISTRMSPADFGRYFGTNENSATRTDRSEEARSRAPTESGIEHGEGESRAAGARAIGKHRAMMLRHDRRAKHEAQMEYLHELNYSMGLYLISCAVAIAFVGR